MSLDSSKSVKRAKTLFAYRNFLSQVRFSKLDTNNWLPLLAFRKCLMAGEVAPESSMVSVVPTEQGSEVMAAYGIRNMACRRSARRRSSRSSTWPAIGIIDGGSEKQRDLLMDF